MHPCSFVQAYLSCFRCSFGCFCFNNNRSCLVRRLSFTFEVISLLICFSFDSDPNRFINSMLLLPLHFHHLPNGITQLNFADTTPYWFIIDENLAPLFSWNIVKLVTAVIMGPKFATFQQLDYLSLFGLLNCCSLLNLSFYNRHRYFHQGLVACRRSRSKYWGTSPVFDYFWCSGKDWIQGICL